MKAWRRKKVKRSLLSELGAGQVMQLVKSFVDFFDKVMDIKYIKQSEADSGTRNIFQL